MGPDSRLQTMAGAKTFAPFPPACPLCARISSHSPEKPSCGCVYAVSRLPEERSEKYEIFLAPSTSIRSGKANGKTKLYEKREWADDFVKASFHLTAYDKQPKCVCTGSTDFASFLKPTWLSVLPPRYLPGLRLTWVCTTLLVQWWSPGGLRLSQAGDK